MVCHPNHGFAPEATTCHPFGIKVLAPGRYVGADEFEDDGVAFDEKKECLTRELATQFHESKKLRSAICNNMQNLGFALPGIVQ